MNRTTLCCLALAALSGCATGRLDQKLMRELPYPGRVELSDARHRLTLAEEAALQAAVGEQASKDLLELHQKSPAPAQQEEAAESQAERAQLEARHHLAVEQHRLARARLDCAWLRHQQDRADITRRAQRPDLKVSEAPGPGQVASCEKGLAPLEAAAGEAQARAQLAQEAWEQARARVALRQPARPDSPFLE